MSGSLQFAPEFSIGKTYDRTPVSISSENIVRDGKALTAEEIVSILFKVKDADDNTYTDEAPTNAGEYTVKITAKATEEHEQSVHIEDFVINPKKLSLKIVPTKPYDGKHNMIGVASEKLEGVISPDKPTLNVMMTSLNAGSTYKEYNIIPSSGGNEKNNYIINEEDTNLKNASITPKKLNLINPITWQYNGKDYMEVTSPGIEGLLSTKDNPTIKVTMTSKNAGATYKSVEVISSENGYEAVNYIVDKEDTNLKNASITKKPIKISETPTKEYDGEKEITVKTVGNITGHVSGDMPEIKITMSSKNVGAKYESHTVIEAGLSESNYIVSESSVEDYLKNAQITKKPISISTIPTKPYDAKDIITVELNEANGCISGDKISILIFMFNKNVGAKYNYHRVDGSAANNYELKEEAVDNYLRNAEITKRTVYFRDFKIPKESSLNYRFFVLGPNNGVFNNPMETVKVEYKNTAATWDIAFFAKGGEIANIGEITNYDVNILESSMIKILPDVTKRIPDY